MANESEQWRSLLTAQGAAVEQSIVDYAVAEIRNWADDNLITLAIDARTLLKSVIDSGRSPTDCLNWIDLKQSLDLPIASNDDAWHALSNWDTLSGGDDFVFGLRDDRLSIAKIGIFAFVGRLIMHRFGEDGTKNKQPFDEWKNRLCSSLQRFVS